MRRLGQLAGRACSVSVLGLEVPLVVLWVALASALSLITARVADWNAMTDELVYERLAISVGQWHSVLPRLHGELVRSLAQLYPVLISPWFWHGYVPEDLRNAHMFNAWLMSSACIPAFLLARRVTGRRWPAYMLAVLTVCTPWIIYSTVLLTEVAGYPAFLWALLAMQRTIAAPSARNDLLALLGVLLAFFARTQFVLLLAVLPLALFAYQLARAADRQLRLLPAVLMAARAHRVLVCVYGLLLVAALSVKVSSGHLLRLSVYGNEISGSLFPPGTAGSIAGHAADLAFGLGILPFLVGFAWLLANALRPPASVELSAFACIGAAAVAVLLVAIAAWDLRIGHFVLDRYLYYLVPILLLGFLCALLDRRRPRWSLLTPVALVAVGFATHLQEEFTWSGQFPLNTDSPIATLYKPIADLGGGPGGAATILTLATIAGALIFVLADGLLGHVTLTAALAVILLVAFPIDTAHTFDKLFSTNGHSGRPLSRSESGILDWLDRSLGTGARVTEVPYPVSSSFFVSQEFWRDLEFWNKSVRYAVHYPTPDAYADAVIWFPNTALAFDSATGAASRSPTPYVVQGVGETRFRISGTAVVQNSSVMLIRADMPWRADWLTFGLYDDGWMHAGEAARIRLFPAPHQRGSVTRTLDLRLSPSPGLPRQSFDIASNLIAVHGETTREQSALERIVVCVPAGRFTDVRLTTPESSIIPGDPSNVESSTGARRGGLFVADVSVADEIGSACRPSRSA